MGHHKRKRPKNRRAGCLMCKVHKANGVKGTLEAQTIQERKAREAFAHEIRIFDPPAPTGPDMGLIVYWDWEDWQHTWSP